MKHSLAILLSFVLLQFAVAADFYVDSKNGSNLNDGSKAKPFQSLQFIFDNNLIESRQWPSLPFKNGMEPVTKNTGAKILPGDTIWLKNGYYGELFITGYYNSGNVTIAACPGHAPKFRKIHLRSSSNWTFKGLHVSPKFGWGKKIIDMIRIESHSFHGPVSDVTVEDCNLFSTTDTSKWTKDNWNNLSCNGIFAGGNSIIIRNNKLKNVNFGISVEATHSLVEHNVIENFAGDGLRGLGDHCVFQYNIVKNCYDVNGNHDDGFQSWSRASNGVGKGQVVGIVLRGNTIINYEDPGQPFRGSLQGIGCFDGMFVDWVIENNVVMVDHWHGITLLGARNCRIINNTVVDLSPGRPGPPWIQIGRHKKGQSSSGCIIRNNLSTSISPAPGTNMKMDHNLIVVDYDAVFKDYPNKDLSLIKDCIAIDKGSSELAPKKDILGTSRPQGKSIDLGAYEFVQN